MRVIPEPLLFEWDRGNIEKNMSKHLVTNKEAEEVFNNKPFITFEDSKHSQNERRFQGLGFTDQERKIFISFTVRESKVRVISVRDMSKKERRIYEEKIEVNS